MDNRCPYCGAETRPGDNFCLNCGNRLLPATPSSPFQQAQPAGGDNTTLAAPDDWAASVPAPSAGSWQDSVPGGASDAPTYRADSPAPAQTVQATMDKIEQPGRLILRSENGEVVQEYPLDKLEIAIGRAPNSDILLSKDKLTSRRHATVHYKDGQYILQDERSANGTFVNGQQLDEGAPHNLSDGDHIGIGEHELIYRAYREAGDIEDPPTMHVFEPPVEERSPVTSSDALVTVDANSKDEYATQDVAEPDMGSLVAEPAQPSVPAEPLPSIPDTPQAPAAEEEQLDFSPTPEPPVAPVSELAPEPVPEAPAPSAPYVSTSTADTGVTLNRLISLAQPTVPDMSGLMAALSSLDGQISALQQQFNETQEAIRNHENEVAQTTSDLRVGLRRVSDRMDSTIADVARSREALAWAELLQLMEDVMNNPRDIEYVTKLARKARELNKVFHLHQHVLNTMAECNSLLRGMIGEDK
ncbi:MAG: FHA domain-containing protein [Ktedonobacteraceae bacterium]|nr:FHA domain-containing protein [Ktedonobacteraceae bacterium]MBO0790219.1 FHA domain-containing protein [Ktedonobacteraceae bacterium]